ncbi:uncharacterized protein [Rutidosis leptorrhynchoides]|uniref:uncharacterized protein n=1 Tax=Rutidosis leptorrhynchoides TaxID=125765 RepID=UPI003A997C6F
MGKRSHPISGRSARTLGFTIKGSIKSYGYIIKRLHVDTGCGVDIMYVHYFWLLPRAVRAKIIAPSTALSGFSGESAWPIRIIELELELVDDDNKELVRTIPSTVHGLIKFPTLLGITTIRSETQDASVAAVEQAEKQPTSNTDVFSWKEADMNGVPREIAEHKLNANLSLTPVRQKKCGMAPERSKWLKAEVDKLVKANILREVRYQTWVANPVL